MTSHDKTANPDRVPLFGETYIGKILLIVLDKVLIGAVVIVLLTPMQQRLSTLEKRHDKAVELGDTIVNKSLEAVERAVADVDDYTAAVHARALGGQVTNDQLTQLRAKIDAEVKIVQSYLPDNNVRGAGSDLSKTVQLINHKLLNGKPGNPSLSDLQPKTEELTTRVSNFVATVVATCRAEVEKNVDAAYAK